MHSDRKEIQGSKKRTPLPTEGPPGRKGTWEARDENAEARKAGRAGRRDPRLGQGRWRAPGERSAAVPRLPDSAQHRRPHRPSAGPGAGFRPRAAGTRAAAGERGTGRRRPLPAWPLGKRDGGRVAGVCSRGSRRGGLRAYLSPGLASSLARRTEELVVQLEEESPTRVSTIPSGAPSLRHRSNRNHRNRRNRAACSSPPLRDWPSATNEHAQSPHSRGIPGQPALPAINSAILPSPVESPVPTLPSLHSRERKPRSIRAGSGQRPLETRTELRFGEMWVLIQLLLGCDARKGERGLRK
nr:uncharacterized protein LOC127493259 [Oryctolagus cuniculus]